MPLTYNGTVNQSKTTDISKGILQSRLMLVQEGVWKSDLPANEISLSDYSKLVNEMLIITNLAHEKGYLKKGLLGGLAHDISNTMYDIEQRLLREYNSEEDFILAFTVNASSSLGNLIIKSL